MSKEKKCAQLLNIPLKKDNTKSDATKCFCCILAIVPVVMWITGGGKLEGPQINGKEATATFCGRMASYGLSFLDLKWVGEEKSLKDSFT